MRNRLVLLLLGSLLLILIIPALLAVFIKRVPINIQPSLEKTLSINRDQTVKQTFYIDRNNLSGIGLSIKNPNFVNKKNLNLDILNNGNVIRSVTISGYSIADGNFINLEFEPIRDSKNKEYTFTLSSPQTDVNETFSVYASENDLKYNRGLFLNNDLQRGTSSFVLFTRSNNPFGTVISIYSDWIGHFFQDILFATFYLVLIGLLVLFLVTDFKFLKKN